MDIINLASTAIGSVGFPIVCCYFMFNYIRDKDKQINTLTQTYDKNLDALTDSLNKNTQVLEKLMLKLDMEG